MIPDSSQDEKIAYLFGEQRDPFPSSFLWKSLLLHTPPKIKRKIKMLIWGKLVTQQETCLNVSLSREESPGSAEWIPKD